MGHHDTLPSAIRHAMHYAAAAIDCCSVRKVKPRNDAGHHHSLKNIYASKGLDPRLVQRAVTSIGFLRDGGRLLLHDGEGWRVLPARDANFHHAALIDNIETNTTAVSLPTALDIL